jgi:hypothetical protein
MMRFVLQTLVVAVVVSVSFTRANAQLIGHWAFDNPTTTTTLLADTSAAGANNSGVFSAGTTPVGVAGVIGGAIDLQGNQTISVGSSPDFETTSWTTSMWVNTDTLAGWRTAFGSWGGGPPNTVHLGLNDYDSWGDHGGGETSSNLSANINTWYHIVSRRSPAGQENSLWINGVKQTQTSTGAPATPGTSNVYIGTKNGTENHFDGRMDDLGYFTRQLADGEIRAIYTLGLPASLGSTFDYNYDLSEADQLFAAYNSQGSAVVDTVDQWSYAAGLNAIAPGGTVAGDLFTSNGRTYLLLSTSGSGSGLAFAQLPEPTTIVVWGMLGAIGLVAYGWRRKR